MYSQFSKLSSILEKRRENVSSDDVIRASVRSIKISKRQSKCTQNTAYYMKENKAYWALHLYGFLYFYMPFLPRLLLFCFLYGISIPCFATHLLRPFQFYVFTVFLYLLLVFYVVLLLQHVYFFSTPLLLYKCFTALVYLLLPVFSSGCRCTHFSQLLMNALILLVLLFYTFNCHSTLFTPFCTLHCSTKT